MGNARCYTEKTQERDGDGGMETGGRTECIETKRDELIPENQSGRTKSRGKRRDEMGEGRFETKENRPMMVATERRKTKKENKGVF